VFENLPEKRISVESSRKRYTTLHPYTVGVGDLSNINPSGELDCHFSTSRMSRKFHKN